MHCATAFSPAAVPRAAGGVALRSGRAAASCASPITTTSLRRRHCYPLRVRASSADDEGERGDGAAAATRRVVLGGGVVAAVAAVASPRNAEAADAGDWTSPGGLGCRSQKNRPTREGERRGMREASPMQCYVPSRAPLARTTPLRRVALHAVKPPHHVQQSSAT
jgi:hypothetical protein